MDGNSDDKLPCEDCITLAICRSQYNEKGTTLRHLTDKCKLLHDYLFNNNKRQIYNTSIDITEYLLEVLGGDKSE